MSDYASLGLLVIALVFLVAAHFLVHVLAEAARIVERRVRGTRPAMAKSGALSPRGKVALLHLRRLDSVIVPHMEWADRRLLRLPSKPTSAQSAVNVEW